MRAGLRVHWEEEGWSHQSDGEEAEHVEKEVMSMWQHVNEEIWIKV